MASLAFMSLPMSSSALETSAVSLAISAYWRSITSCITWRAGSPTAHILELVVVWDEYRARPHGVPVYPSAGDSGNLKAPIWGIYVDHLIKLHVVHVIHGAPPVESCTRPGLT